MLSHIHDTATRYCKIYKFPVYCSFFPCLNSSFFLETFCFLLLKNLLNFFSVRVCPILGIVRIGATTTSKSFDCRGGPTRNVRGYDLLLLPTRSCSFKLNIQHILMGFSRTKIFTATVSSYTTAIEIFTKYLMHKKIKFYIV